MSNIEGSIVSSYETYGTFDTQRTLYYTIIINELNKNFIVNCALNCMVKNNTTQQMTVPFTQNAAEIKNKKNNQVIYSENLPFDVTVNAGQTKTENVVNFSTTIDYDPNGTKKIEIFDNYVGSVNIDLPNLPSCKIKINNQWKKACPLIKLNGIWKRCTMWKKINGIWKIGF